MLRLLNSLPVGSSRGEVHAAGSRQTVNGGSRRTVCAVTASSSPMLVFLWAFLMAGIWNRASRPGLLADGQISSLGADEHYRW